MKEVDERHPTAPRRTLRIREYIHQLMSGAMKRIVHITFNNKTSPKIIQIKSLYALVRHSIGFAVLTF